METGFQTLSRFEAPNLLLSSDSSNLWTLEDVDDQLLLRDADELLATFTSKRLPLSGAERRERYRKRQKSERERLKKEAVILTKRLEAQMKQQGPNELLALSIRRSASSWRIIAMKEKQNRLVAEAWQKQLRGAVADHAALIVDLQDMISRRVRRGRRDDVEKLLSLTQPQALFRSSNGMLIEACLGELTNIYRETDKVFNSCASSGAPSGRFSTVVKDNGDVEHFEIADVKNLPFEFEGVCELVWEVISLPHRQTERRLYNAPGSCGNEFAVRFRVICPREVGEDMTITTHFVARRYTEESRTVVVWRGLMEGEGEFAGLRMEETGWCVISAAPREVYDGPLTVVLKCARVVPLHFNAPKGKVHEFSELILRCLVEVDTKVTELVAKLRNKTLDDVVAVVSF